MKSLTDDAAAYSKVIDCNTAHDIWKPLQKEYGQSSNVLLCILELQLSALFNKDDTSMLDHIDQFPQLIEQMNYHLGTNEKWFNG